MSISLTLSEAGANLVNQATALSMPIELKYMYLCNTTTQGSIPLSGYIRTIPSGINGSYIGDFTNNTGDTFTVSSIVVSVDISGAETVFAYGNLDSTITIASNVSKAFSFSFEFTEGVDNVPIEFKDATTYAAKLGLGANNGFSVGLPSRAVYFKDGECLPTDDYEGKLEVKQACRFVEEGIPNPSESPFYMCSPGTLYPSYEGDWCTNTANYFFMYEQPVYSSLEPECRFKVWQSSTAQLVECSCNKVKSFWEDEVLHQIYEIRDNIGQVIMPYVEQVFKENGIEIKYRYKNITYRILNVKIKYWSYQGLVSAGTTAADNSPGLFYGSRLIQDCTLEWDTENEAYVGTLNNPLKLPIQDALVYLYGGSYLITDANNQEIDVFDPKVVDILTHSLPAQYVGNDYAEGSYYLNAVNTWESLANMRFRYYPETGAVYITITPETGSGHPAQDNTNLFCCVYTQSNQGIITSNTKSMTGEDAAILQSNGLYFDKHLTVADSKAFLREINSSDILQIKAQQMVIGAEDAGINIDTRKFTSDGETGTVWHYPEQIIYVSELLSLDMSKTYNVTVMTNPVTQVVISPSSWQHISEDETSMEIANIIGEYGVTSRFYALMHAVLWDTDVWALYWYDPEAQIATSEELAEIFSSTIIRDANAQVPLTLSPTDIQINGNTVLHGSTNASGSTIYDDPSSYDTDSNGKPILLTATQIKEMIEAAIINATT